MECYLVKLFGWSLYEIEQSDAESLLRFINEYPAWSARHEKGGVASRRVYADQVDL